MKNFKEFKPLWNFIKEERIKLILASIFIFISEFAEIANGYLNGASVEAITNMELKRAVSFLVLYLFFRIVFDSIVNTYASSVLQKIESKVTRKLGFNTYKKALDLPSYAYEKTSSGEIINRITNDADTLSFAFGHLLSVISALIGSFVVLIYVFINSWIIGIEITIFMIIFYFITNKYNPKLKEVHKQRKKGQDEFSSLVNESIRGIREIKTLGIKKNLINEMNDIIHTIFDKSKKEVDIWKRYRILSRVLKAFLEVLVFLSCVVLLYYKMTTLTFFIAMTYYVYRFMWLIENINDFSIMYQKTSVALSRVNELLENRLYEDEVFGNKTLKDCKGVIEFKNVTFAYPDEKPILKDFNLKLEPNKKIAIIGKSGQGKSTLFNMITRIFDPIKGEVLLDGINIKDLTENDLRKNISIIRQEPFIFNRTIKDNFKLVNKNIKLSKIKEYSKMAYLDEYIDTLPKKYNTKLGEGGVNLSGGQKQRLSIARALTKESKVLLFDEATSALDNNSQEYIKKAIDNLVKDHTVVIVAHRLSTIIDADIIYVVDKGKVVAQGSHNELLKTNAVYKGLYETESLNS